MSNLSSDYEGVIREGLLARRESVDAYGQRIIDALLGLTDRYRAEALRQGKTDLAAILEHVPRYGAVHFREALQSFRILHFGLWLEGDYHNTIGRFDKIMYPYLKADMEQGLYSEESALELVKDFFLSFNKDSDLYPGVQQGNNGQSMMLGGIDADGGEVNAEQMKDAQLHPENHQQLIVRIWGWSAYFVELDREYQDHVIARQEYTVGLEQYLISRSLRSMTGQGQG